MVDEDLPEQMIRACYECGVSESRDCGHGKIVYMKKWQADNVTVIYNLRALMNI